MSTLEESDLIHVVHGSVTKAASHGRQIIGGFLALGLVRTTKEDGDEDEEEDE